MILFDDMIADMLSNEKLDPTLILTKSNLLEVENLIYLFSHQAILFFSIKNIRLIFTLYFIIRISNKQKFNQMKINDSSDFGFMRLYNNCTDNPFTF